MQTEGMLACKHAVIVQGARTERSQAEEPDVTSCGALRPGGAPVRPEQQLQGRRGAAVFVRDSPSPLQPERAEEFVSEAVCLWWPRKSGLETTLFYTDIGWGSSLPSRLLCLAL